MGKPDPQEAEKLLKNRVFKAIIADMRDSYTAGVMAPNTTEDDALVLRREYAALERFIEKLTKAAKG